MATTGRFNSAPTASAVLTALAPDRHAVDEVGYAPFAYDADVCEGTLH